MGTVGLTNRRRGTPRSARGRPMKDPKDLPGVSSSRGRASPTDSSSTTDEARCSASDAVWCSTGWSFPKNDLLQKSGQVPSRRTLGRGLELVGPALGWARSGATGWAKPFLRRSGDISSGSPSWNGDTVPRDIASGQWREPFRLWWESASRCNCPTRLRPRQFPSIARRWRTGSSWGEVLAPSPPPPRLP